ncbi:MAG: hypothetical protein L3J13_03330, partial [Devosiaceae bacterium]|nr:hypothetical protein [Devosiaceae bacterium]
MSPLFLGILVFVCIGALGIAFVPSLANSGRADKRIKAFNTGDPHKSPADRVAGDRDRRRKELQQSILDQPKEKE